MAKHKGTTGKLKRSKARKESEPSAPRAREASVGELLAALEQRSEQQKSQRPDALGLAGYEDDDTLDDPAPAEPLTLPREDGVELSDTLPMAPEDDLRRVRGQASPRLMSVVESLLFASDRPLTVRDIRKVLKEPTVRQVQLALKHLQIQLAERGVILSQVAGGFRLRTNPANAQWVQRMLAGKPARLSRSQLEALAVIAYRQPITKAEIDHVRGVDCGAVLRVLLERDLARIVGRKEEPGRPHLYGTTVEFLEFFNLRSLRDMPDLHEFRELTDESRATLRSELGEDADEVEAEVLGQEVLRFDDDEDGDRGAGEASEGDAASDGGEASDVGSVEGEGEGETSDAQPDEGNASEASDEAVSDVGSGDGEVSEVAPGGAETTDDSMAVGEAEAPTDVTDDGASA